MTGTPQSIVIKTGKLDIKNTFYHVEDPERSQALLQRSLSDSSLMTSSSTTSSSLDKGHAHSFGEPGSKSKVRGAAAHTSEAGKSSAGQTKQKSIVQALRGREKDLQQRKLRASGQENAMEVEFYEGEIATVRTQILQQERLDDLEELIWSAKQRQDVSETDRLTEEIAKLKKQVGIHPPREGAVSGYTATGRETWSIGSELHHLGQCKPCAFFWSKKHPGGCSGGSSCTWCHLCPEGSLMQRRKEFIAETKRLNPPPPPPPPRAKGRSKSKKDTRPGSAGGKGCVLMSL